MLTRYGQRNEYPKLFNGEKAWPHGGRKAAHSTCHVAKRDPFSECVAFSPDKDVFSCWFIISKNWRHAHYSELVEEINCLISTSANATKQLGRCEQQQCLVSTFLLDATRHDVSMERQNCFGGSNFIVQEKMFQPKWKNWVRIVLYVIVIV